MKKYLVLLVFLFICLEIAAQASEGVKFGNAVYVNLSVGERLEYAGKTIEVVALDKNRSLVRVDGEEAWLAVAKRSLPQNIGGLRIFVSDQVNVKNLTTDPEKHNLLQKDVVLCISDPAKPLLHLLPYPNLMCFGIGVLIDIVDVLLRITL